MFEKWGHLETCSLFISMCSSPQIFSREIKNEQSRNSRRFCDCELWHGHSFPLPFAWVAHAKQAGGASQSKGIPAPLGSVVCLIKLGFCIGFSHARTNACSEIT